MRTWYGYDGWQDAETFYYTGEGRTDYWHTSFLRGNKAIRIHRENNKNVDLFENFSENPIERRGKVCFITESELHDFEIRKRDSAGIPEK